MAITLFKRSILTLLGICSFMLANSQQQSDSLIQYLEIASKNNPLVLQKLNEYQAALQKVPQAGGLNDPEISIGVFLSPMEIISGKQVADIRLMQMFPWFGVLKSAKDEMSLMAQAKYEIFLDAKYQVYFEVQKTWYELYKIQENIRLSEENIELLHSVERISLAKFSAVSSGGSSYSSGSSYNSASGSQNPSTGSQGMNSMGGSSSTPSKQTSPTMGNSSMGSTGGVSGLPDLYRIQIDIGELENNIALLKSQLKAVSVRFNSYLNRPASAEVSIPEKLFTDTLEIPVSAIADSIKMNNPMLEMLKYEQQSLDARRNMLSRMGYPMIGIGVNYSVISKNEMSASAMNGNDMIMPMVTATLPIYRKKYKAMQTEAEFMKEANVQNMQAVSNTLLNEYYEALQLYEDSQRRLILYENQSMLAQKALDILIKSFSADGTDLSDVLISRQQILEYDNKKVEALADFNTAIAWLQKLMAYSQIQ